MTDETRIRFLTSIAAQIPAERVAEVHLFSAIRQGGMESGVAVIALEQERVGVLEQEPAAVLEEEPSALLDEESQLPLGSAADAVTTIAMLPTRYVIFSARYRHTLKGIDRGKWEVSVTEEADAPLLTVDAVVRGVQRRSGDTDESTRLSGDEFRTNVGS